MKLRKMTLTAIFAALCAVGGFIKIPSGVGSLALDTVPALLAAAFLPPVLVGTVSMTGHLASAMYAGFPLGPFHVLIAIEMMIILYVFARLHKAGHHTLKWVFFIVANGLLAPLPFYFLVSPAFFVGVVPAILVATIVNAVVAAVVMPVLSKAASGRFGVVQ
ncbi:ECF transporter S component [Sporosarcina sp. ACRSL]|uniref:ECF transporter S component n=1 Tax=Sporosarcina sp. ACRSL TaxID=2918215 RepID=UPI001EF59007|nr:ECF transporter S component [Sporosarcina sp. ACRSL]MCG7343872.1 ECF transporter S component [Sporosarcina sp. ACRSL]